MSARLSGRLLALLVPLAVALGLLARTPGEGEAAFAPGPVTDKLPKNVTNSIGMKFKLIPRASS
jgi:stringent starvation protein B